MFTKLVNRFRTRVLLAPQTTATGAGGYLAPTPGVMELTLRAHVKMGNAADLALSLNTADDASGTNATAYAINVPIYKDGVAQTAAKALTIGDASGDFIVDFCVDPATIPAGKTIGIAYADSNAGNLVAATLIEDVAYKPTAS